jgi:hypothetical protein
LTPSAGPAIFDARRFLNLRRAAVSESAPATPVEHYDWDEAFTRLREAAEQEHPPAWIPTEADQPQELLGVFVGINYSAHTAYGNVPVITLRGPNGGLRSVWLHHQVLRNAFMRERPAIGEMVYIKYLGKVEPKGGGTRYADYKLVVDRPVENTSVDWARLEAQYGADGERGGDTEEPTAAVGSTTEPVRRSQNDDDIPF